MNRGLKIFRTLIVGTLCLLLTVAFILAAAVISAGVWIRTDDGQTWLKGQITAMLAETPYKIEYGHAYLRNGLAVSIDTLQISDPEGVFLSLKNADLSVSTAALVAVRSLSVKLQAGEIHLIRAPLSKAEAEPGDQTFDPTAFWIRNITLNRLSVERLIIGEALTGQDVILSPDFEASIDLNRDGLPLEIKGDLRKGAETVPYAQYMPLHILIEGELSSTFETLKLAELRLEHEQMTLAAKGDFGFSKGGQCNGSASLNIKSLSALFGVQDGAITANLTCSGAMMQPKLESNGEVIFMDIPDVDPVRFKVETQPEGTGFAGAAQIEGAYRDQAYKLVTPFRFTDNAISLPSVEGTLPEISLTGNMAYSLDAGVANGSLKIAVQSFKPYADMLDIPVSGQATASLVANGADQKQGVSVDIAVKRVGYDQIELSSATIKASSADIKTRLFDQAELKVSGVFASGLTVQSGAVILKPENDLSYSYSITAQGQYDPWPLSIKGTGSLGLTSKYAMASLSVKPLSIVINGQNVDLNGTFSPEAIDMKLAGSKIPVSAFAPDVPDGLQQMLLSAEAAVSGSPAAPEAIFKLNAVPGRQTRRGPDISLVSEGAYRSGVLSVKASGSGRGINTLSATANIPFTLSLMPFSFDLPQTTPLNGKLNADLDIGRLSRLALPYDNDLRGNLKADVSLGGTLAQPAVSGAATMRDGSYQHITAGVGLKNISLDSSFSPERITISSLSATDGENGTLKANGWIEPFGDQMRADIGINAQNLRIVQSDIAEVVASADLSLKPMAEGFMLSGQVNLPETNIHIPERFGSSIPELNTVTRDELTKQEQARPGPVVALKVKVRAPNQIFVRGWGLDAEFGGGIDVAGTVSQPEAFGQFSVLRGRFDQLGKRFSIDKAQLVFQGEIPPSPLLDVSVSTPAQDVTAKIVITGQVTEPKLSFASEPALPQDEVLSRLLFGKDSSSITPLQAIQLANTLAKFSGKGGGASLDPIGTLRNLTGLDQLQVDTGDDGQVTVGAGKYITDKIYVEAEQGNTTSSSAVKVQAEITPSVSLESKVGQEKSGAGLFWKRDY